MFSSARQRDRRGAMVIMVAMTLVLLLVAAVFSIDVAYMHVVRSELRTATDAAAQAGSEALARTQDLAVARARAIEVAQLNTVAGEPLTIDNSQIEVGGIRRDASGKLVFDPAGLPMTAVRIRGGRTTTDADGTVGLFFARLFGAFEFQPVQFATASSGVRDVALVLDVSGSMNSRTDAGITRLQALQNAVNIFLDEVETLGPATRVSLTTYATSPAKVLELTGDLASVRAAVARLRARGLTNIGGGIQVGSDSIENDTLARPFADKAIVVMTDGNHNRGLNPVTAARNASALGHTVHAVTFSRGANQRRMQLVAAETAGGSFTHADGAADLSNAFRDIARTLFVKLIE